MRLQTMYLVVGDVEVPSSLRIDVLEPEDMAPALEFFILSKVSKNLIKYYSPLSLYHVLIKSILYHCVLILTIQ